MPVDRAVITHAHSDHATWGSRSYLTSSMGVGVLRLSIGDDAPIESVPYGDSMVIGDVRVSLYPAGHILGSSQVRIEHKGEVWVVSGDYKTEPDQTAGQFEPVACHTFITESTFGLPIYRWRPQVAVFDEINTWWQSNADRGWTSILYAYALGKSQRIIAGVDSSIGPIAAHGAVMRFLPAYATAGVKLPEVISATVENLSAI
jgi:putative mRNA 3-end processing factor